MLLAPQNKKLRELEAEDPTLSSRIRKAFDLAKKKGYERHVFVELKDGRYVHLESLNADTTGSELSESRKVSGKSKKGLRAKLSAFLAIFGF